MKTKKNKNNKKKKKLTIKEMEKKVLPSLGASKKIPIPPPYPAGADYGLAKRSNIR